MEIQVKCVQVFSEIDILSERMSQLGKEAKLVLAQMINSGVGLDSIDWLLAKARKAEKANLVEDVQKDRGEEKTEKRRCKWWNRGFCREKEKCPFLHPKEDCQDHMQGRCILRGCTLRHRRECKFFSSKAGCIRGEMCAYIHKKTTEEKDTVEDSEKNLKEKPNVKSREVQTETELKTQDCICKKAEVENEVVMEEERIICIFKRIQCSEEEWDDIEETVRDSGMGLEDMLGDWAKVMEAYHRIG